MVAYKVRCKRYTVGFSSRLLYAVWYAIRYATGYAVGYSYRL